jgi:hypothetical protein
MRKSLDTAFIAALVLFGIGRSSAGSGNRTGTSGANELLIPVGTRDIAMAGATTAISSGVEALFWNPAGAAKTDADVSIYASHMSYIADIGVNSAAVSARFEPLGVLSLELKALSFGDIPLTTVLTPDGTGATFSPQFFTVGLTYSRQLTDRIAVGVTGLVIAERMADVSANGVAFNVGVVYDHLLDLQGLSFGLAVKNIGPQMKFEGSGLDIEASAPSLDRPPYYYKVEAAGFELPSTFEIGIGYRHPLAEDHGLLFAVAFQNNNYSDDEYKIGMEYEFQDVLFLRGGYDYSPSESDARENIFGATFGAGVHTTVGGVNIRFDYAFRAVKFFESNHIFSLTLGL